MKKTSFSNTKYCYFTNSSKYICFILFLFLSFNTAQAQYKTNYTKYWVGFTDKPNSEYFQSHPELFLSKRAIERRQRFDIPINYSDLPVSNAYLQQIKQLGVKVLYQSKWLNGAVVFIDKSDIIPKLHRLSFVKEVEAIGKNRRQRKKSSSYSQKLPPVKLKTQQEDLPKESIYYGVAFHQTEMLKGDYLHAQGFTGQGMLVAVMDAGFSNVEKMKAFGHLYENHQIVGTYDFVDIDRNPYHDSTHGTHVLSTIAAKLPGQFVGTAPDASFWLFRTEDNKSETRIEEYNWLAAAEMADSAGVDVVNTSLGYTTFDDSKMDYTKEDLNGNTAVITRVADMAASKGMLIVISAGNKGNKKWQYLTTPADADSVLTIGAVTADEDYAIFSSIGLESTSNVKPNLVSQGQATETITIDGTIRRSNGTSFSAPIMAGLVTCLWQAHPQQHPQTVIDILQKSANQYENPSTLIGYGIPDFRKAYARLNKTQTSNQVLSTIEQATAFVYPNPFDAEAQIYYHSPRSEKITLQLFDLQGKLYQEYQTEVHANEPYRFGFSAWQYTPKGIYVVRIANAEERFSLRAVKTSD